MVSDNHPLCCCEYFDVQQERNHILACCCNCQDFDEGFDSFISGRGVPQRNRTGLMTTLHDRCRIPWRGGARQINGETVLPIVFVLTFLVVATGGPVWTVLSGCTMVSLLSYLRYRLTVKFSKSKFFYKWTICSFIILYLLFEFVVITLLEILWEENIALTILIVISVMCFWKIKSENYIPAENACRTCNICQVQVPADSQHSVWLDCCVGTHNRSLYLLGLTTTCGALLYSANLTLTSVCSPYTLFGTILIPSDCSDVYDLFKLRISFVSALYSFIIAVFIFFMLIRLNLSLISKHWTQSTRKTDSYSNIVI